jgi:pentatricopeptide repeat protein
MLLLPKYTPKRFDDFEEEKGDIIYLLRHFITINVLSIMFVGPSSSGKTLLIEVLLSEFFNGSNPHDNILRINSLKEQGIHYYRNELKHFCQNISSQQKFVIIDDIDFLNEQSQQVIQSCIQKHNHHIHFIASCTNSQKVLDTLTTMLLPISIPPIEKSLIEKIFRRIVCQENIQMDEESKTYILQTRNNIKILINDLQKCKLFGEHLEFTATKDLLCDIQHLIFDTFHSHMKQKDVEKATKVFFDLHEEGFSVTDILYNYFEYIKTFCDEPDFVKYQITKVITKFTATFHVIHEDMIELALFVNNLNNIFCEKK